MSVIEKEVREGHMKQNAGFSSVLRSRMKEFEHLPYISFNRLYERHESRLVFTKQLIVLHSYVRAVLPLMEAALARCHELKKNDPMCDLLGNYYEEHIEEERGHDEMLLDDLESIGITRERVLQQQPLQCVAEFSGSQYYWVHHYHPVILMGYIAVLEGYPVDLNDLERLKRQTGLPDTAFRTLVLHGELDPDHKDEISKLLDTLPLSADQQTLIVQNAIYTIGKYAQVMDDTMYARY